MAVYNRKIELWPVLARWLIYIAYVYEVYELICPRPCFDDRNFLVQLCPANWQRVTFVVS